MNEANEIPKLLKPREAAAALAISERALWSLTAGKQMPCVRIGRSVRYVPADLAAYIERHRTNTGIAC